MRVISTWIKEEISQPICIFWQWSRRKFFLFCMLSLILQSLCFILFPSIWLPVKQEYIKLIQPNTYIRLGRVQNIVFQQQHLKYLANCAWQSTAIAKQCSQIKYKQTIPVQEVTFIYLTTPLWHYRNSKKEIFIQSITTQHPNTLLNTTIHANNSEQENWGSHQQKFTPFLKWILILNLLHLSGLLLSKIHLKMNNIRK